MDTQEHNQRRAGHLQDFRHSMRTAARLRAILGDCDAVATCRKAARIAFLAWFSYDPAGEQVRQDDADTYEGRWLSGY